MSIETQVYVSFLTFVLAGIWLGVSAIRLLFTVQGF